MNLDEYDILREHGEGIARINENLTLLRKELNGRIPKLEERTDEHDKQINFWRGAIAVVAFILLLVGGVETWHIFVDHTSIVNHAKP